MELFNLNLKALRLNIDKKVGVTQYIDLLGLMKLNILL